MFGDGNYHREQLARQVVDETEGQGGILAFRVVRLVPPAGNAEPQLGSGSLSSS